MRPSVPALLTGSRNAGRHPALVLVEAEDDQRAARGDRHALLAVHGKAHRVRHQVAPGLELPQRASCARVEGVEVALVRAVEDEVAGRG